ncbi:MAG: serine racemase VanT catalytic subunit [Candidatus Gastranaerophilales bacterium]|nr:serine racemase VanT catalytic subunit [Candidatus Gastranaerophilales bacterium]
MKNGKSRNAYTGIDYFRFVAALLVVAIHTSPLTTYSETGDFILTRIVARVAVPFFLMTSGFFLITEYARDGERLKRYLKKTAMIYGLSIVLYLPLNLYSSGAYQGNLSIGEYFLLDLLKDLFFDGTMYHLWYLPASMLGAAIAWFLVRRKGYRKALVITGLLYVAGLFGDSYYGLSERVPLLEILYGQLFTVSDYTRNGFFFTPLFFVLGGFIKDRISLRSKMALRGNLICFGVSFLCLLGEGMSLHTLGLQRHDSMYLFLPPCVYFLFVTLTFFRGNRKPLLRTSALFLYIMHPMVIVAVRGFAKVTHLREFLVENSLMHYLAVSVLSAGCSLLGAWLYAMWRQGKGTEALSYTDTQRAWIEVDQGRLRHNIKELQNILPKDCRLMAVVKAEGYGHGMLEVAACANRMGVKDFAVATIEEGIALRRSGITGEILILGYTHPGRARELHRYDLTQTLVDYEYAVQLNRQGCRVKTHIKIDTGMHRLGLDSEDSEKVLSLFGKRYLQICGIYTHLCVADSQAGEDVAFTQRQIDRFYRLLHELEEAGAALPPVHIQSSYGLLNYPELQCDYVRVGIALYGCLSAPEHRTKLWPDLRPALSLKARVVLVREVKQGESVGYGRAFVAKQDSKIALISIGYGDGFPRNLSGGRGEALIGGKRAPIVGKICMDQMMADVTHLPDVRAGMTATLIGRDGEEEIAASDVAGRAESITNELLCRLGDRVRITGK